MMNSSLHAHVPYLRLFENLEYILRERINPEIYFSSEALDILAADRLRGVGHRRDGDVERQGGEEFLVHCGLHENTSAIPCVNLA